MEYKDIIKGCQKGKASSQRELVRRFAGLYKSICLRYLPDGQSADDAVQEAFINVFNNIQKFRDEGSFEGWMKRVAVNTSLNYRKKHFKAQQQHLELISNEHERAQVPDAMQNLRAEELIHLIKRLPEQYYLVFSMYVIEGMSHQEIGDELNITSSTSRATLSRARTKLIALLNKEESLNNYYMNTQGHGL